MLYLVTGTPGAGKTLNTIKFVNEAPQFQELSDGSKRQVYYHGIRDLDESFGWIELSDEQVQTWFELPPKSVIVLDEAYTLFPVRHGAKQVPAHVQRLATHRHQGFDIVMICQKVNGQLDPFVRGLVGQHRHYQRIFGSKIVTCFVWDSCQDNPNSAAARNNANSSPSPLDKKYFGAYHSADEHTHKASLPWGKIILVLIAVAALVALLSWIFARFEARAGGGGDIELEPAPASTPGYQQQRGVPPPAASPDHLTFAQKFTPEIANIPWSAPVYAEQIQPRSWPRPAACILRKQTGNCSCFTQQATRLDVTRQFCLAVVHEGFYDWTRPDFVRVAYIDRNSGGDGGGESLLTPTAADSPAGPWGRMR